MKIHKICALSFIFILSVILFFLFPRDVEYIDNDMTSLTFQLNSQELVINGDLILELYNPNYVSLNIESLDFDVQLSDVISADVTSNQTLEMNKRSTVFYTVSLSTHIPLSIQGIRSFGGMIFQCLREPSIDIVAQGTVQVDHFLYNGHVDVDPVTHKISCSNIF